MVLHVEAGLPAFAPALERRKNIRVTAAVEEKTFAFAQADEVDPRFEEMSAPGMRKVALDSEGERRARRRGKRRIRVAGWKNLIGTRALVDGGVKQSVRRKRVQPAEYRGVLAEVPLRVAADGLIIGNIGLLKIRARAHQQKFDRVVVSGAPVELRRAARAFAKIKKLFRLGRIEVASGRKSIDEEIVAERAGLPAVVGVEIVVLNCRSSKIHVAVSAKIGAGSRGDVEYAAETVSVFGSESSGHQVHGFENLRADAGRKLRLRVVQKGDTVDKFVQRKFGSAHVQEIVMAVAGAGHQIVDQIVRALDEGFGQPLEILARKRVRAPGFFCGKKSMFSPTA